MKILLITDKDIKTKASEQLMDSLISGFNTKKHEYEIIEIGEGDLASCLGCFGCWIKTPGKCVIKDSMTKINESYAKSDYVLYLTPVIFGQYSANIKDALDRWLPNVLPFFVKKDGLTRHPKRYDKNPYVINIGYGDSVSEEEKTTFFNVVKAKGLSSNTFMCDSNESCKEIAESINKII